MKYSIDIFNYNYIIHNNTPILNLLPYRIAHGSKYVERGSESRLVMDNVTYDYQGDYECRATSYINGQERVAISDPVSLQVVGKSITYLWSLCGVAIKTATPQNMTTTASYKTCKTARTMLHELPIPSYLTESL